MLLVSVVDSTYVRTLRAMVTKHREKHFDKKNDKLNV